MPSRVAVPLSEIKAALTEEAVCEQRERKLNMVMTVLVTIAMNLYARISIWCGVEKSRQRLALHLARPGLPRGQGQCIQLSALSGGTVLLANLFHRVRRPMTTCATPGAFLFGLRLMAIDGTVEDVPDTPDKIGRLWPASW